MSKFSTLAIALAGLASIAAVPPMPSEASPRRRRSTSPNTMRVKVKPGPGVACTTGFACDADKMIGVKRRPNRTSRKDRKRLSSKLFRRK